MCVLARQIVWIRCVRVSLLPLLSPPIDHFFIMIMTRFLLFLALVVISSASSFSPLPTTAGKLNVRGNSNNIANKNNGRFLTCEAATAPITKQALVSTKPFNLLTKKNAITWMWAFTAGLMNIVCSIRFGSSALMMTGNYVALGRSLAKQAWVDVSFLLCLVINYCGGFVFSRAIETKTSKSTITSAAVLAMFAMADALAFKFPGSRWQGE